MLDLIVKVPFRSHTIFAKYILYEPVKYRIKEFRAWNVSNACPFQGQINTVKPADGRGLVNVGERIVCDLGNIF